MLDLLKSSWGEFVRTAMAKKKVRIYRGDRWPQCSFCCCHPHIYRAYGVWGRGDTGNTGAGEPGIIDNCQLTIIYRESPQSPRPPLPHFREIFTDELSGVAIL